MQPLLATKLIPPRPRANRVVRPRLIARVREGLAGPVTLISAPAGFGKSTVLADALQAHRGDVAWLSVDAADSDPLRFLRYLLAAVRTVVPTLGAQLDALLQAGAPQGDGAGMEAALTILINEIAAAGRNLVLVLDDYQLIDAPPVDAAVGFLLDHLPEQLHLVIATREDPPLPLARLRARGQLVEVRAADLRFTTDEAATLLREVMGLPLSLDDVAALDVRIEGWAAGLQLAALALREADDPSGLIATLRGTHRYLLDYLADEVLHREPAHVQQFLLAVSILDRLSASLCAAVLRGAAAVEDGAPSSANSTAADAQQILEQLERANLFITALDHERRWYRFHPLFADLLRSRLQANQPERVPALYRQAALWYLDQAGSADTGLVNEAMRHALAGQAYDLAADLMERWGARLLGQGELHTAQSWLAALPATAFDGRPRLHLARAWVANLRGEHMAAEASLQAAEAALERIRSDQGDGLALIVGSVRGNCATIRAYAARHRGDIAGAIAQARAALASLSADETTTRTAAELILGVSLLQCDQLADARQHLEQAIGLGTASGNRHAALAAQALLGALIVSQGQLRAAETVFRQTLAANSGPDGRPSPLAGDILVGLGQLLHEWNDLGAAVELLRQGLAAGEQTANWWTIVRAATALAWSQQAQGEHQHGLATLQQVETLALQRTDLVEMSYVLAQRARLQLAAGNLPAVAQWLDAWAPAADEPMDSLGEPLILMRARALIALGRPADAVPLLQRLRDAASAAGRIGSLIPSLTVEACALNRAGDRAGAVPLLEQALALAKPNRYIRTFVDEGAALVDVLRSVSGHATLQPYIQELLAVCPPRPEGDTVAHGVVPTPPSAETPGISDTEALSAREIELLRLLAAGLSNREIAERLMITVGTVIWYFNHLYAKLGVRGRLEAVARARELAILP